MHGPCGGFFLVLADNADFYVKAKLTPDTVGRQYRHTKAARQREASSVSK